MKLAATFPAALALSVILATPQLFAQRTTLQWVNCTLPKGLRPTETSIRVLPCKPERLTHYPIQGRSESDPFTGFCICPIEISEKQILPSRFDAMCGEVPLSARMRRGDDDYFALDRSLPPRGSGTPEIPLLPFYGAGRGAWEYHYYFPCGGAIAYPRASHTPAKITASPSTEREAEQATTPAVAPAAPSAPTPNAPAPESKPGAKPTIE